MQLTGRLTLLLLVMFSTAAETAGQRSLGRSPRGGPTCSVQAAVCRVSTPLFSFGRHPMTVSTDPIYAQGSVTVSCEKIIQQGVPITVTFDLAGLPPADPRQLASGQGAELDYGMYLDATRTRVWGDGTRGTEAITDVLEMQGDIRDVSRTYLLYGRVNGRQSAHTGNYLGTINAEMRYGTSCN